MKIDIQKSKVSIREAYIAREVSRASSVRNTARILNIEPGPVSRILSDLERKVGFKIFSRSQRGVYLTPSGESLIRVFDKFLNNLEQLDTHKKISEEIKICSTSFLNTYVSSKFIVPFLISQGKRPYLLDTSPDQLIPFSIRNAFEIAVHFDSFKWPGTWVQKRVVKVPWVLCVQKNLKVPKNCTLEQVKKLKFVHPVYYSEKGVHFGNDFCPLPKNQRAVELYTATADSALMSVVHNPLAAFLPKILVEPYVQNNQIKILSPKEWKPIHKTLYLSVKSDIISNKLFNGLVERFENLYNKV